MRLDVHVEDRGGVLISGALTIIGVTCLVFAKRVVDQQVKKMKADIINAFERSIRRKEQ